MEYCCSAYSCLMQFLPKKQSRHAHLEIPASVDALPHSHEFTVKVRASEVTGAPYPSIAPRSRRVSALARFRIRASSPTLISQAVSRSRSRPTRRRSKKLACPPTFPTASNQRSRGTLSPFHSPSLAIFPSKSTAVFFTISSFLPTPTAHTTLLPRCHHLRPGRSPNWHTSHSDGKTIYLASGAVILGNFTISKAKEYPSPGPRHHLGQKPCGVFHRVIQEYPH